MKYYIRNVSTKHYNGIALVDEKGEMLPNQTDIQVNGPMSEPMTAKVTFVIQGLYNNESETQTPRG